jgi:hypothetical protein
LTIWVPVLLNLTWSKSFLPGRAYPYVKAIVAFMRVSLVELLCQAVMGQILALEYMLSDMHGLLRLGLAVPGI